MDSSPCFVARYHEHPPATLEELLRASDKRDAAAETANTDSAGEVGRRLPDDEDSDSDYHDEMRRQRGRMDEKEAQWVRGYIKAQRAWRDRTGHSIDEFHIPQSIITRPMKKARSLPKNRPGETANTLLAQDEDEETVSLFTGVTRLETLLLLAAIVFVSLSLGVQLYVSTTNKQHELAN